MLFPPRCISFARQAGSEIFASFSSLLTSSLLACSARPGASLMPFCVCVSSWSWCCVLEILLSIILSRNGRLTVLAPSSHYCLACAKRPAHKRPARGPNFHFPHAAQRDSIEASGAVIGKQTPVLLSFALSVVLILSGRVVAI